MCVLCLLIYWVIIGVVVFKDSEMICVFGKGKFSNIYFEIYVVLVYIFGFG